jgi:hypothetical protein
MGQKIGHLPKNWTFVQIFRICSEFVTMHIYPKYYQNLTLIGMSSENKENAHL